jgi:hypothetical protein
MMWLLRLITLTAITALLATAVLFLTSCADVAAPPNCHTQRFPIVSTTNPKDTAWGTISGCL